jgi:hypothetical protein
MSQPTDKIEIKHATKEFIVDNLVEPYYKDMVKATISGKKWWRTLGITFETSSKIMVAIGGILGFSAGFYHDDTLSFVSGSVSCMSLALLQIASFSYKENKKQGDELNILLKKLNLDTVPLMPRSEDQTTVMQARTQGPTCRSEYTYPKPLNPAYQYPAYQHQHPAYQQQYPAYQQQHPAYQEEQFLAREERYKAEIEALIQVVQELNHKVEQASGPGSRPASPASPGSRPASPGSRREPMQMLVRPSIKPRENIMFEIPDESDRQF